MVARSFPRRQVPTKNFHKLFLYKFFMVAKSIPRKQFLTKNFNETFCGRYFFLWLQNHFLENRILTKIFIMFFCGKFIIVSKSYSRNFFLTNIFYGCKIGSSKTDSYQNISWTFFLVENFLSLQNHFLENKFAPKIFIKNVLVVFYGCKIISSKAGLQEQCS